MMMMDNNDDDIVDTRRNKNRNAPTVLALNDVIE